MAELKPCPFCGGSVEFSCTDTGLSNDHYRFRKTFKLWCPHCGCSQNRFATIYFDYSPHLGFISDEKQMTKAIEAWNRRANESNSTNN